MRALKIFGKFLLWISIFVIASFIICPIDEATNTLIISDKYIAISYIASIILSAIDWKKLKKSLHLSFNKLNISWRGDYTAYYADTDFDEYFPENDDNIVVSQTENNTIDINSHDKNEQFDCEAIIREEENWCACLLENVGFSNVNVTPTSRDQGVDVLAEKDGIKYAIQCKCFSHPVGNDAVQAVHSGKSIYSCHVGIVMTNRSFTPAAKEAANATGVLLWDREKIIELIKMQV